MGSFWIMRMVLVALYAGFYGDSEDGMANSKDKDRDKAMEGLLPRHDWGPLRIRRIVVFYTSSYDSYPNECAWFFNL